MFLYARNGIFVVFNAPTPLNNSKYEIYVVRLNKLIEQ